eukprot:gene5286-6284_t
MPGVINRRRLDGTFDVHYDSGDRETQVTAHNIRAVKSAAASGVPADCVRRRRGAGAGADNELLQKRDGHLKRVAEGGSAHASKHRQGAKVACYWYRPTKFGSARLNKKPKAAIVMRFNADNTYTVEIVEDHTVLDDVE